MASIITRVFNHLGVGGWSTQSVETGSGGGGGDSFNGGTITEPLAIEPTADTDPALSVVSPGGAVDYTDVFFTKNADDETLFTVDSAGEAAVHIREAGADGLAIIDHVGTSGKLIRVSNAGGTVFEVDGEETILLSGTEIGFFGHVAVPRPNVGNTGSETVQDVINALLALGLVSQS